MFLNYIQYNFFIEFLIMMLKDILSTSAIGMIAGAADEDSQSDDVLDERKK